MINALAITQRARLVIQLDFKSFAKVNALSVALSGGSAVFLAYNGWGMWALVAQNLLNSVLTTGLLWI
ncbi:oligosaccharide flippase family protein, partial [Salmonella enterica]|uniref:oligosaccharide flippase family protein n=1 Tax=Salmonella enterica TaxID=28901 RepID=UPI0032982B02